jgi:signal transduction histidine kinase
MRLNITQRTAMVMCTFGVVCVILTGYLLYHTATGVLVDQSMARLQSLAAEEEATFSRWLNDHASEISRLASLPQVRRQVADVMSAGNLDDTSGPSWLALVEILELWAGPEGRFAELRILDARTGRVIAASDAKQIGKFNEHRAFFVDGLRKTTISSPFYSLVLRAPALFVSTPVSGPDGDVVGVLAGRVRFEFLQQALTLTNEAFETQESFLVNRNHLFLTQPRFLSSPAVLLRGVRTADATQCLKGENGIREVVDYRGEPVFSAYRWIKEFQICVVTKIDRIEALEPANRYFWNVLYMTLAGTVLAIVASIGLARGIALPIVRLKEATERFERGDRETGVDIDRRDEIGDLAEAFNAMAESIGHNERALAAQAEELRRSNTELEQFAYIASHDLQEPLRKVRAFGDRLHSKCGNELGPEGRDYLDRMRNSAARMQTLINDLLAFSRITTKGKPFVAVDLGKTVETVIADMETVIEELGARVKVGDMPTISADPTQMYQLFQNLIGNALKFRDEDRPPVVNVNGVRPGSTVDTQCEISISDNGIGFDQKHAEKIFGFFQRLHGRGKYEGTGIGLAVCKKVVHRHGGNITASSGEGEGSTFTVILPRSQTRLGASRK